MRALTRLLGQSAEQGALCSMYAATADLPAGSYIGPDGPSHLKGSPTLLDRPAMAEDLSQAAKVWEFAEQATSGRADDMSRKD